MSGENDAVGAGGGTIPVDEYCRQIERYLTRKNDGHLIRVVGPSFERVRDWARRGIPLQIAYAGIDRHFERYYRKGPRRRPVLIDFCEPDILEAFDDWRRAVGLSGEARHAGARARERLSTQIERAIVRLTMLRGESPERRITLPAEAVVAAVAALEALLAQAHGARGAARTAVLEEITRIDDALMAAARTAAGPALLETLEAEAAHELAPFRERMPAEQWPRSLRTATERLLRDLAGIPILDPE